MRITEGVEENGVVVGNAYDKYNSQNPVVRYLMKGFETFLHSLVKKTGVRDIHEVGCREGYWTLCWLKDKTQIAKFIPGNIFHIAGRQVVAAAKGASHSQLVAAAALEIVMMLLAAGLVGLLAVGGLLTVGGLFSLLRRINLYAPLLISTGGVLLGLIAALYLSRRFSGSKWLIGIQWPLLVIVQLSYLLFFSVLMSALLFRALTTLGDNLFFLKAILFGRPSLMI